MALHCLTSITIGVPLIEETAAYYEEFGLKPADRRRRHRSCTPKTSPR
jgi:hypothetical protein